MKTLLMSDLHIGFKYSRAQDVLHVLNTEEFDRLVLVGDIFDIQQMMKRPYWDEHHTAVLKKILKLAKKKAVIYVIGNHDYPLFYLQEYTNRIAGLSVCREYSYSSGDKDILCIHGDQMDKVSKQTMLIGDFLYYTGLKLNKYLNKVRKMFGLSYWSLSKWCKDKIKHIIHKAFDMDTEIQNYLDDYRANVLVYGHTHMPLVSDKVVNTGTFVEIATYVTEEDGVFTLHEVK